MDASKKTFGAKLQGHPVIQKLILKKCRSREPLSASQKQAAELLANAINMASRETFELISALFSRSSRCFYFFRD